MYLLVLMVSLWRMESFRPEPAPYPTVAHPFVTLDFGYVILGKILNGYLNSHNLSNKLVWLDTNFLWTFSLPIVGLSGQEKLAHFTFYFFFFKKIIKKNIGQNRSNSFSACIFKVWPVYYAGLGHFGPVPFRAHFKDPANFDSSKCLKWSCNVGNWQRK